MSPRIRFARQGDGLIGMLIRLRTGRLIDAAVDWAKPDLLERFVHDCAWRVRNGKGTSLPRKVAG